MQVVALISQKDGSGKTTGPIAHQQAGGPGRREDPWPTRRRSTSSSSSATPDKKGGPHPWSHGQQALTRRSPKGAVFHPIPTPREVGNGRKSPLRAVSPPLDLPAPVRDRDRQPPGPLGWLWSVESGCHPPCSGAPVNPHSLAPWAARPPLFRFPLPEPLEASD